MLQTRKGADESELEKDKEWRDLEGCIWTHISDSRAYKEIVGCAEGPTVTHTELGLVLMRDQSSNDVIFRPQLASFNHVVVRGQCIIVPQILNKSGKLNWNIFDGNYMVGSKFL